ncbi:MAG TPA: hypothetical protein VFW14_05325 [Gaiellales bacterium]|nr:hypothetical protein [Gaiellales bacterium]
MATLARLCPSDHAEFERWLVDHELALMKNGFAAPEATLRLTVIRVAREALQLRAEIARLEEVAPPTEYNSRAPERPAAHRRRDKEDARKPAV